MTSGQPAAALETRPVSPGRLGDLDAVFSARGCSVAKGCYCMYYRATHAQYRELGRAKAVRDAMRALVEGGEVTGLIGYLDGEPVGWVSLGPREAYRRLETSKIMAPVDGEPVWSVVCFVVPSAHRGKGLAAALLRAAVDHARRQGARWLEAYPVDLEAAPGQTQLWFGTAGMYRDQGFVEVARRKPGRPVMRLRLQP